MVNIICAVIAGVCTVLCAIIGAVANKNQKKSERRAQLRQKESLLSLRMMDATLQLSVVTSNALTGGHNNGNVETAREAATKVSEEYQEFMRGITAFEVGK